jgi:hypothetical protein
MPRIRTIKPDFFTSPSTAAVDFPVRIFFEALWCWADDFGIGETNLHGLLGFAFPDSDGFSAQDLRRFCADCAQHFEVTFYTVRGRHYYAIPTWEKHQKLEKRTDRRKHPTPDDPDATPDMRIYGCADSAPTTLRVIGAKSRGNGAGNRNRGTGEIEKGLLTEVCHQGDTEEPPKKCSTHINDLTPPACSRCADARKANDAWNRRQRRERDDAKRAHWDAVKACTLCDDHGLVEVGNDEQARCTHAVMSHA